MNHSYQLRSVSYRHIIRKIDLTLPDQGFIGLVGRNGSGKSTLLHLLSSWYRPSSGAVLYQNQPLKAMKPNKRAQQIAWLGQHQSVYWNLNVCDVIRLGKYAQRQLLQKQSGDDIDAICKKFHIDTFSDKRMQQLSGGQQALVHMARLFASGSRVWLIDEFDASLDLHHQIRLFQLLKQESQKRLIICAMHDLNMARIFSDQAIIMDQGSMIAYGENHKVLQKEQLSNLWELEFIQGDERWLYPKIPL